MVIYRAEKNIDALTVKTPHDTRRQPAHIPYLVDNLWEWARPDEYPNRRHSKFAHPHVEQAQTAARDEETEVGRVQFQGEYALAQLVGHKDAKFHPDCRRLKKIVRQTLDQDGPFSWATRDRDAKHPAGQLYYPCLTAREVEQVFQAAEALRTSKDEIQDAIGFWDDIELVEGDALPSRHGECFFTYPGGYRLIPVSQ